MASLLSYWEHASILSPYDSLKNTTGLFNISVAIILQLLCKAEWSNALIIDK